MFRIYELNYVLCLEKNRVLNFPAQTSNLFKNEWKKIHFSL